MGDFYVLFFLVLATLLNIICVLDNYELYFLFSTITDVNDHVNLICNLRNFWRQ